MVILLAARHLALVAAAGALLAACDVWPQIAGYRTLTVEPTAQRLDWQNPVYHELDAQLKAKAVLGSYYSVFTNAHGGTSVEHILQRDAAGPRARLSYLETNLTDHLVHKSVNTREILRGPFGTVYSEKTCYFHMPIEYWNQMAVHLYADGFQTGADGVVPKFGEPATVSDEPPDTAPAILTNVSVIRVLRGGPQYVVAAAMYGGDGHALTLSVEGGRDGDWVQGSVLGGTGQSYFNQFPLDDGEVAYMTQFGLPPAISIQHALTQRSIGLATPSRWPVERDAINLHYGYDRWMRQDEYLATGEHHTRYLTYERTPEDIGLAEACAQGFREREARPLGR